MSVTQVIEEAKSLSESELRELIEALQQEELRKYNAIAAQRWAGKTFDLRSPTDNSEPLPPFARSVTESKL
jgi:hypothetical protein